MYTDDRASLREAVARSEPRDSAVELVRRRDRNGREAMIRRQELLAEARPQHPLGLEPPSEPSREELVHEH